MSEYTDQLKYAFKLVEDLLFGNIVDGVPQPDWVKLEELFSNLLVDEEMDSRVKLAYLRVASRARRAIKGWEPLRLHLLEVYKDDQGILVGLNGPYKFGSWDRNG
jgi:hypothetical protein